jgi:hypothetical protein
MDKNAGSVFEQRRALARLRAHLRDEVRTKNAGSVFEQRKALALLRAHLRDEVRNRAGRAVMDDGFATFRSDRVSGAGWISQLIGADFVDNIRGGHRRPLLLIQTAQQLMHKLRHHFARQAVVPLGKFVAHLTRLQVQLYGVCALQFCFMDKARSRIDMA